MKFLPSMEDYVEAQPKTILYINFTTLTYIFYPPI